MTPPPAGQQAWPPLQGNERLWVPATHWLALVTTWLGPLVVLLTVGERNALIRWHALQALNFQITLSVATLAASLLLRVSPVGLVALVVLVVVAIICHVTAAVRSASGVPWRYPVSLRLVR